MSFLGRGGRGDRATRFLPARGTGLRNAAKVAAGQTARRRLAAVRRARARPIPAAIAHAAAILRPRWPSSQHARAEQRADDTRGRRAPARRARPARRVSAKSYEHVGQRVSVPTPRLPSGSQRQAVPGSAHERAQQQQRDHSAPQRTRPALVERARRRARPTPCTRRSPRRGHGGARSALDPPTTSDSRRDVSTPRPARDVPGRSPGRRSPRHDSSARRRAPAIDHRQVAGAYARCSEP